ncbi:ABC transporter permease [Anaeromicropila populeti]|uniref:Nucleoside ABC transporter membrane protein n=1 Tax=Anaeromicropila populeti TaxID=37658 RepID=A0A1I6I915_9FIRM|nr:ABC transporter permease [Anaeromicropila populeti]SFR63149.1 nucleoside ABC transporter membrane protein [Anaeromicropila populeti]
MSNRVEKKIKEPFIRIEKRADLSSKVKWLLYTSAFFTAIVVGGIFLLAVGVNPLKAYGKIVEGAFRSKMAVEATIKLAVPLLISSLGITLAFKMKFWNIGAEGQIIMGGIFSTYFALFHADWPHFVLMTVMLLAGILGGGLWAVIPAWFKTKYGTNETLFTLMLNYIALYLIKYLTEGPWKDPEASGFPKIASFEANARLDKIFNVHAGWLIGLLLVLAVYAYLKYTKQGFEISIVGESQNTARYAGMNVKGIVVRTLFLSGAICGIAGMCQVSGAAFTLSEGVAGGVGFTAIIVAWLARLNPFIILVITAGFSILEKGCSVMQSTFGISTAVSSILQGIILFVILAFDFFSSYKLVIKKQKKGGAKNDY